MSTNPYANPVGDAKVQATRVLVGLSGGVHSAVTAAILKAQGYELLGMYLETGFTDLPGASSSRCCLANSREAAEKLAAKLGIELLVTEVKDSFEVNVIESIVHDLGLGRTSSPCIPCNQEVRVRTLIKRARELKCNKVATGHRAQVFQDPRTGECHLLKGTEEGRDQSFYLYGLKQQELAQLLLPLGNFPRTMVGKLAQESGLSTAQQSVDSQGFNGMCFMEPAVLEQILDSRLPPQMKAGGPVRTHDNRILTEHTGFHRFHVGMKTSMTADDEATKDWIIVSTDPSTSAVILGPPSLLLQDECVVVQASWVRPLSQVKGWSCGAALHPSAAPVSCQITFFENDTLHVRFNKKQGPLISGQTIVFYQDQELLGGGWIQK